MTSYGKTWINQRVQIYLTGILTLFRSKRDLLNLWFPLGGVSWLDSIEKTIIIYSFNALSPTLRVQDPKFFGLRWWFHKDGKNAMLQVMDGSPFRGKPSVLWFNVVAATLGGCGSKGRRDRLLPRGYIQKLFQSWRIKEIGKLEKKLLLLWHTKKNICRKTNGVSNPIFEEPMISFPPKFHKKALAALGRKWHGSMGRGVIEVFIPFETNVINEMLPNQ